MRKSVEFLLTCIAALCLQGLVSAQVVVSEDFEGAAAIEDTSLDTTYIASSRPYSPFVPVQFDGETVTVGGFEDSERVYLGTRATDFGLRSFTAEIDVTVFSNYEFASSNSFFGIGAGEGLDRAFEEPVGGGNPVFLGVTGIQAYRLFDAGEVPLTTRIPSFSVRSDRLEAGAFPGAGAGTHRLRLEHDVDRGLAVYSIDIESTGSFEHVVTFDTSNNAFDSMNSRIFFGGSDGRIFDNFTVELTTGISVLKGDVDLSGEVNFSDIQPFIASLASGRFQLEADCDCNGTIDFSDIPPFIGLLVAE